MSESNMELFRCPKCGNKPVVLVNDGTDLDKKYVVKCVNEECNYRVGGYGLIKSAAVKMWNIKASSSVYLPNKLVNINQ